VSLNESTRSQPAQAGIQSATVAQLDASGNLTIEATRASKPSEEFEKMARRRYQDPKPERKGNFWWIRIWKDEIVNVVRTRKRQRIKLAPASMPEREVRKIAAQTVLQPINQGLVTVGSAVNFSEFVEQTYKPIALPLLAKPVQDCYSAMIAKYLEPVFGFHTLRDMTRLTLQRYFSTMLASYSVKAKVRDVLSSIMRSAVEYDFLAKNPMDGLRLPPDKRARGPKPTITPQQFQNLVMLVPEPYASMLFVAVWTGLRVSELIGLKWRNVHSSAITIEARYCRGDWSTPKTKASAATIGVEPHVIARIGLLKTLTLHVKAGRSVRHYKAVKASGPDDLVFQSVKDGKPMNDQNVLKRYIQPAAKKLGLQGIDWRCLRRSHATWLVQAGADPKSVQAQMRHSRISTTMDIYAQIVPVAQRMALEKLSQFAGQRVPIAEERVPLVSQKTQLFDVVKCGTA